MSRNSNKGGAKLASTLQKRMAELQKNLYSIPVQKGEIVQGNKLKLYSVPDAILDRDDYSVCSTIQNIDPLSQGDQVLIVMTEDGDLVVIDKIIDADKI